MFNLEFKNITLNQLEILAFFLYKNRLQIPRLILLNGEEGVGKSTFCKKYLFNIDEKINFQSPTFSIFNIYRLNNIKIIHADFYRLPKNTKSFELYEYLENNYICLVEWNKDIVLKNIDNLELNFFYSKNLNERNLILRYNNKKYKGILQRIKLL